MSWLLWILETLGLAALKRWWAARSKSPELVEAEKNEAIAQKQIAIVSDRDRPDASDSLHDGSF